MLAGIEIGHVVGTVVADHAVAVEVVVVLAFLFY